MSTQTRFTPTEVCTLIAHETVSMLDTVQTEIPQCVRECRTALEALTKVHNLGEDGETLLDWLDTEIANAELYVTDGKNLPYLIDMEYLAIEPDAVAQMDLVWLLFETAAAEKCEPEQRQALVNTAQTITEMCGLDDLLLATLRPNEAKLTKGLNTELDDIRCALKVNEKLYPRLRASGNGLSHRRLPSQTAQRADSHLAGGPPAVPTVSAPGRAFPPRLRVG